MGEQFRTTSQYATPDQIEEVMGIPDGSINPIAWMIMQEEAKGVSAEVICANLNASQSDVDSLKEKVTGLTGSDAAAKWLNGVISLKAVSLVNQQNISSSWDTIEAIATEKIAKSLATMKGPGDIDRMLALAATANKAVRRGNGESSPGSRSAGSGGVGVSVELRSGPLGTIQLNLSPAIQAQLSRPNRIIDAVRNRDPDARASIDNLEMLNLKDTRTIAKQDEDELKESTTDMEVGGMRFSLDG